MTKAKETPTHHKGPREKELKGKSNLFGRVKKVIKKSRRKLGEEKFEKELRRTIEFLAELQGRLNNRPVENEAADAAPEREKRSAKRAEKAEKKGARTEAKKTRPGEKSAKKASGKGASKETHKKGNGTGRKSATAVPTLETVLAAASDGQPADQQSGGQ
jgi:hypothetical protein